MPHGDDAAGRWSAVERALARVATAWWLPAALVLVFVASAVGSLVRESATFDETAHLPAGYSYLTQFDYRLTPEHPPLAKLVSAFPLVVAGAHMPGGAGRNGWQTGNAWTFGYDFLYRTPGNDADTLLTLGRLPIVALGALLCLLVYIFARDISGEAGGRMALFCAALSPSVLAHARLATTDIAMALFYLASVHAAYLVGRRLSPATAGYLGLALGFAWSTKFSALLLLPIVAVLLSWRAVDGVPLAWATRQRGGVLTGRVQKARALGIACVAALALAYCVIWSTYGFRYGAYAEAGSHLDPGVAAITGDYLRQHPTFAAVLDAARTHRLLPESYLDGFAYLAARSGVRSSYLLGDRSMYGFSLFFPVAFLVKTPLPLVLLTFFGVAALLMEAPDRTWPRRCVAVAALVYLGVSLAARLNIGERHLLPVYPFLFMAIGSLAPWIDGRRGRLWRRFAVLAAWYVAAWAAITPHYLAYFNELALGPKHGDRVLADSNLDWGQDVKALGQWTKTNRVTRLPYAHFGTTRPQYYGIDPFISLPGASMVPRDDRAAEWTLADLERADTEYVAIHVTNLRGVYLPDAMTVAGRREAIGQHYYRAFWEMEPVARIGYSINVYRNPWRRDGSPR